jgi:hypothetical protein
VDTLVGRGGLYRAELDQRVAKGTVYLARYLPAWPGHIVCTLGPLVRVTTKPATSPPMQKRSTM